MFFAYVRKSRDIYVVYIGVGGMRYYLVAFLLRSY